MKAGVGVTAFFCFMFSWVELLLARTLTSVDAKPIAATMIANRIGRGHGLGNTGCRRGAHAGARRPRHLLRSSLHRERVRDGAGLTDERIRLDGLDRASRDLLRVRRRAARRHDGMGNPFAHGAT